MENGLIAETLQTILFTADHIVRRGDHVRIVRVWPSGKVRVASVARPSLKANVHPDTLTAA